MEFIFNCKFDFYVSEEIPGQRCSTLNLITDDNKLITSPLLPVDDETHMTLSCNANYVNLESTTSTAECKDGIVVATSTRPRCVKGKLQTGSYC